MSRHILQSRAEVPHVLSVAIGWSRSLQTFYVQVFLHSDDPDDDKGEVFLWMGTEPGELATAEAAVPIIAPYAIVPEDLVSRLTGDLESSVGLKDGHHEAEAKRRLFGSIH